MGSSRMKGRSRSRPRPPIRSMLWFPAFVRSPMLSLAGDWYAVFRQQPFRRAGPELELPDIDASQIGGDAHVLQKLRRQAGLAIPAFDDLGEIAQRMAELVEVIPR